MNLFKTDKPTYPAEPSTAATPANHDTAAAEAAQKAARLQAALDAEKQKRRTRPWLVVLLSLLLVGLSAVATVFIYKMLEPKQIQTTPQTTQTTTPAIQKIDAAQALAAVKTVLPDTKSTTLDYVLLALKAPGYSFNTNVGKEDYTSIKAEVTAADNAAKLAEIGKALKDKGLTEGISDGNTSYSYSASYKGSDAVCLVMSQGTADNPQAAHTVTAACTNMSTFTEVAAAQKPFYDALKASSRYATMGDATALYGRPVTKASKTAGYTLASLTLGAANVGAGASELYFYKGTGTAWVYAASRGDVGPGPQCSDFTAADAKNAYAGEPCYVQDQASTIKP